MLGELGSRLNDALNKMVNKTVVDSTALDEMLKDISNALVTANVNVQLVSLLRKNIKDSIHLEDMAAGINKRKVIQQIVYLELCKLLDSGAKPFSPIKGQSNVLMIVGLQGAGKTTSLSKLAFHYKRKGWRVGIVCADTFRAGAYYQARSGALGAKVLFYGSPTELDPIKIASDGVRRLKEDRVEIILVDTSGRHMQETELFKEMEQITNAIQPDNVIFVMDGLIGQAAFTQAKAFRDQIEVGAVIITKLDGDNAKGGGALSAVAATHSPVIFIGTGEHIEDLEPFVTRSFVSKLLGMGDMPGLLNKLKEITPQTTDPEDFLSKKSFTLRDMYHQFQTLLQLGPLHKVMEMLPGMNSLLEQVPGCDPTQQIKNYLTIMDSMTPAELDDVKVLKDKATRDSRISRIARGSGRSIQEVHSLLTQLQRFTGPICNPRPRGKAQQLPPGITPQIARQFGGLAGIQSLMKQMNQGMGIKGGE